jgi:hypothetical protein
MPFLLARTALTVLVSPMRCVVLPAGWVVWVSYAVYLGSRARGDSMSTVLPCRGVDRGSPRAWYTGDAWPHLDAKSVFIKRKGHPCLRFPRSSRSRFGLQTWRSVYRCLAATWNGRWRRASSRQPIGRLVALGSGRSQPWNAGWVVTRAHAATHRLKSEPARERDSRLAPFTQTTKGHTTHDTPKSSR